MQNSTNIIFNNMKKKNLPSPPSLGRIASSYFLNVAAAIDAQSLNQ